MPNTPYSCDRCSAAETFQLTEEKDNRKTGILDANFECKGALARNIRRYQPACAGAARGGAGRAPPRGCGALGLRRDTRRGRGGWGAGCVGGWGSGPVPGAAGDATGRRGGGAGG